MGTRLFVGNLSYNVTELELKQTFTSEGIEVRSVRVACERETGRPRGFAFVETATEDGAKQSIEKLSGRLVQGRALIVEEAQARPAPGAPRPGGPAGPPRFGSPRPQGGPPGPGGAPPRFSGPAGPSPGSQRNFGPPRPPAPGSAGHDRVDSKPEGRRDRPEKKRSTRPKPEERERGNWRWKGVIDED
jgi:RNA recognition motif-containing protein